MDVVYERGPVSVYDVQAALPDPPTYSSVRTMLKRLAEKGHLHHRKEGPRYVYSATIPRSRARGSALRRVVDTFFEGSIEKVVAALLDMSGKELTEAEVKGLTSLIEEREKRGGRA